jgi:hypothetical protein
MESAAAAEFSRETAMLPALVSLLLAAAALNATHRILIVAGGKGSEEAIAAIRRISSAQNRQVQPAHAFPEIVDSSRIAGLNPGFMIAVFGGCALVDIPCLLVLDQARTELGRSKAQGGAGLKGVYYRDVVWTGLDPGPIIVSRSNWRIVPGPKTPELELWTLEHDGCVVSFAGSVAGPAGERLAFDDGPVRKAAGGHPKECGVHWGKMGDECKLHLDGSEVVITWSCLYRKQCEGAYVGSDELVIVERLSARDGKFHRTFEKGEMTTDPCHIEGD